MAKRGSNNRGESAEATGMTSPAPETGHGGEIHQVAGGDVPILTTQQGIPVSDDQNSLRIGARGPTVLEDFHFREKLFHFDHERIPERVVHARGFGAHGPKSPQPMCSLAPARKRPPLSGSPRLRGTKDRRTWHVTCVDLR
jgi:hypothetical protein